MDKSPQAALCRRYDAFQEQIEGNQKVATGLSFEDRNSTPPRGLGLCRQVPRDVAGVDIPFRGSFGLRHNQIYDAWLIRGAEAAAKRRLADEYDAAEERGEVVGAHNGARKRVDDDNAIVTSADLGLRRDQIYDARLIS